MEIKNRSKTSTGLFRSVLTGAGTGFALLLFVIFLTAWLIWSGVIPAKTPSLVINLMAGLCAFAGGRIAVKRFRGGTLPAGGLAGIVLCIMLLIICLGTRGRITLSGPWLSTLTLIIAGGCLAGFAGQRKKKK